MKTHFKFLAIGLLLFSFVAFADDVAFPRYIQKGDKGSDVLLLQKVLNSDSSTQVSSSGIGSSGNETDYYGELTKQAVIKLQKKNNLGTQYGLFTIYSGALDDKTRDFLNKYVADKGGPDFFLGSSCIRDADSNNILSKAGGSSSQSIFQNINTLGKVLDPSSAFSIEDKVNAFNAITKAQKAASTSAPYIKSVTLQDKGLPSFLPTLTFQSGGKIKITGCNFATSTDNTVHMMYNDQKVKSTDGKTLEFTPKSSLQDMFDNGGSLEDKIDKAIPDPLRDAVKKEIKDKVLNKMQQYLKVPGLGGTNSSSSSQQMPGSPFVLTVENDKGVSNPYEIFFKIQ